MKKFYTFLKSTVLSGIVGFALLGGSAYGQVCGPIAQDFQSTGGSTAGFTGDFALQTTGMRTFLEKKNPVSSGKYTLNTPTYQLAANATSVGYGFTLSGSEKVATVDAEISYVSTVNGQVTTIALAQFTPSYGTGSTATTAVECRAVSTSSLPGFPMGGRYRLSFQFTASTGNGNNNNENITFDDFRTNGTLSQAALPVNFIGFDVKKANNSVLLTWKVAGEENVVRYEVERSTDGRNFSTIASVKVHNKETYQYTDVVSSGTVFYRIKNIDNEGKFKYSTIARFANGLSDILLTLFPQPVQNQLTLQHPAISGKALISLSTADGRVVRSLVPAAGSMQTFVDMSTLQKGMYLLRFDAGNGGIQTLKVMKQ